MNTLASKPFLNEGKTAVQGVRQALAGILSSVGANADEPQDISRKFGLDKTLTWRIARVVREEDTWEAVTHIPRRPSIRIFVGAMSKNGAPEDRVEAVWKALAVFERFVETHSGDRETLEMMISVSARKSATKRLELFRKDGFLANSATWGVRARLQLASQMLAPGRTLGELDMTTVCGLVDFRRLRSNVPWAIASVYGWYGESQFDEARASSLAPLDGRVEMGHVPVLREFCSQPLPSMRTVEHPAKTNRFMLSEGPIGNTAAATVFLGWVMRDVVSSRESFPGETGDHTVDLSTPVEELVHDLFIHKDLEFAQHPTAHVYSQLPGGPQYPASGKDAALLPVPTEVSDLGVGPPDTVTPEIPRYHEMMESAAQAMGYDLADFHAYRHRVQYPPIPAMAVLRHRLLPGR